MKKKSTTILFVVIFLVGLSVMCYPSFSNWWNSRTQTRAVAAYDEAVANLTEEDLSLYLAEAEAFNDQVRALGSARSLAAPELLSGYADTLDITGTGIMGYITIDKINVQLPIYHGTDAAVLQIAAGHLEGSTLPIGGESSHAVISAHRGLPSAKLFTNLDALEVGDTFTITVLDQVLTYEVDLIRIVLPTEIEDLYITDGQDYVTLMTCTPYGINTHRLLVRGKRTETVSTGTIRVTAEAFKLDPILVAPVLAVPMVILLLIWLFITTRKKRGERTGGGSA